VASRNRSDNSTEVGQEALSFRISQESREWVRDLGKHQGYYLVQEALQAMLEQAFKRLRSEKDHDKLLHCQGLCDGLEQALRIPGKLLGTTNPSER